MIIAFKLYRYLFYLNICHLIISKSVNKSMIINNNANNIIRVDENPVGICRVKNCRSLCNVETIDAVFNYRNGSIFAFKGNFFWQIMDKQLSPTLHTRKEIGNYWNPNNTTQTPFLGPISAAFKDNNGFTYLFKEDTIYTFKEFEFIESKNVKTFNSINSLILVQYWDEIHRMVYMFGGDSYWEINPFKKMYNWTQIGRIFAKNSNDRLPVGIDAAFEDNDNNVILICGESFIKIPSYRFPHSISDKDLAKKFIYKDLFNCEESFYETTKYHNYDEFIVALIVDKYNKTPQIRQTFPTPSTPQCLEPKATQSTIHENVKSHWFYIMIGLGVGMVLMVVLKLGYNFINKEHYSPKSKSLYIYPKTRPNPTDDSTSIEL